MKIALFLSVLLLASLTACSTMRHLTPHTPRAKKDSPETVIVYYYVKAGQEDELQDTLARAWTAYQKEGLVLPQPHVIVRENEKTENGGQTRFVEVFSWVSHAAPQNVPDSVKTIWSQMQSLCVPHNGLPGPYGGEVELVVPATRSSKH